MRTTIALDDELLKQAEYYTGIKEKAALVREALTRLVRNEAARRLAALGGVTQRRKPLRADEKSMILKAWPARHQGRHLNIQRISG